MDNFWNISQKRYKAIYTGKFFLLWALIFFSVFANGQEYAESDRANNEYLIKTAPVSLDGHVLFHVRGVSSFPAEVRAEEISKRIKEAAADPSISTTSIKIISKEDYSEIYIGNIRIMGVFEADAALEQINRSLLTQTITKKLSTSINEYRENRSQPAIVKGVVQALIAAIVLFFLLFALVRISRHINTVLQNRIKAKIDSVENISFNLIKSNQIWKAFHVLFNTLRNIIIVALVIVFFNYVLSLFPWTNPFAVYILDLFIDPLLSLGKSFANYIPKLIFLIIIYFITKHVLKLVKLFFIGIEGGGIMLKDFRPEWALSTFKIIRTLIIAFAIVIAYPYIPGSDSVAFKGVSVFVGILFSIGGSGFIGNLIAGYSMIYRGAFRQGDLILVDDQLGFVEEQQLLVTRLRSNKNEEIILPNSLLLNSKIVNYTVKAKEKGVILHTVVGIGYETPWRQVDAMLKLAASRTQGLEKDPPPYVLKQSLGDFAVNYEINAYCKEVSMMKSIYSLLHQNILDVFNENNVQIMTPAYEQDPEIPKVVPKDQWETPLIVPE